MTIHTLSDDQTPTILTVPGLMNSGPGHWQSLWEKALPDCHRVELGSWDAPHRNAWITNLGHAIAQVDGPVILAAHSLGAIVPGYLAPGQAEARLDDLRARR